MSEKQNPCSPLEWDRQFIPLLNAMFSDSRMKKNHTLAKYHTVIAIGGYLGLRPKALLGISFADLLEKSSTFLRESKIKTKRQVVIQDKLKNIIDQNFIFLDPEDVTKPILTNREGKQISTQSFNSQLKKLFLKYDIVTTNPSAVTLRKTYALRLFERGGSNEIALLTVQRALGHRTREHTKEYLGINDKQVMDLQALM